MFFATIYRDATVGALEIHMLRGEAVGFGSRKSRAVAMMGAARMSFYEGSALAYLWDGGVGKRVEEVIGRQDLLLLRGVRRSEATRCETGLRQPRRKPLCARFLSPWLSGMGSASYPVERSLLTLLLKLSRRLHSAADARAASSADCGIALGTYLR